MSLISHISRPQCQNYFISMSLNDMNSMCLSMKTNLQDRTRVKFFLYKLLQRWGYIKKYVWSKYSQVTQYYIPRKNHSKLDQRPLPVAHNLIVSLPIGNLTRVLIPSKDPISLVTSRNGIPRPIQCMPTNEISESPNVFRRSSNYQPSIWHYDYIQSLRNEYVVHFVIVFHLLVLLVLVTITRTD